MNDLISRQAAVDKADSLYRDTKNDECYMITGYNHAISDIRAILKSLPSAQPEQRWIPVSKRMPESRIDVWCNSDMGQMVGYYDEYAETWYGYGRDYLELIVTAWMPLPEPYKAESEDKE